MLSDDSAPIFVCNPQIAPNSAYSVSKMPEIVHQLAPAKLNLTLAVSPRRADLHPIQSWMITVNLFDELELQKLPLTHLSRYAILWHEDAKQKSEIDWSITKDLAVRAHLAVQKHLRRNLPIQLTLQKRIPTGGGLGGGSSDAAAMLLALNSLYKLNLSSEELAQIATPLGSDIPFLLTTGSATVYGTGSDIKPHKILPHFHAVLVFPPLSCPTAAVYTEFDNLPAPPPSPDLDSLLQLSDSQALLNKIFNHLAPAAEIVAPKLQAVRNRLESLTNRRFCITGSGSTLFTLCTDPPLAHALASEIENHLDLPAIACRSWENPDLSSP